MTKKDDDIAATSAPGALYRALQPKKLNIRDEWETIGLVLDTYNSLEGLLASAIRLYIGPKDERVRWVEDRLLNNLVIPFSAKVKLVRAISRDVGGPPIKPKQFDVLMRTRNAMAHGNLFKAMRFKKQGALTQVSRKQPMSEPYLVVESVTGNGELQEVNRDEAVSEFLTIANDVTTQLESLLLKFGAVQGSP